MTPRELLERTSSAELSELFVYFKITEEDREAQRRQMELDHQMTAAFGDA